MSRLPIIPLAFMITPLIMASGCTHLGSNVNGSFNCRAPNGSCAPTSIIDASASGIEQAQGMHAHGLVPKNGQAVRHLQIVLAAYRDEAGREHEARVVHVILPDPAGSDWRAPQGRRDVLRSLAATIAGTRIGQTTTDINQTKQLPEQLFTPLQPVPAVPGADAPETGGPGLFSPPREPVPHIDKDQGEMK